VELVKDSLYSGGLLTGQHFAGLSNYKAALTSGEVQAAPGTGLYALIVLPVELIVALPWRCYSKRWATAPAYCGPFSSTPIDRPPGRRPPVAVHAGRQLWHIKPVTCQHWHPARRQQHPVAGRPTIALLAVGHPDIWLTTSFVTLVLFAGLQALPADVYEAAKIDGAGPWQAFLRITVPLLRPVIAVVLVIRLWTPCPLSRCTDRNPGRPQQASTTMGLEIYNTFITYAIRPSRCHKRFVHGGHDDHRLYRTEDDLAPGGVTR